MTRTEHVLSIATLDRPLRTTRLNDTLRLYERRLRRTLRAVRNALSNLHLSCCTLTNGDGTVTFLDRLRKEEGLSESVSLLTTCNCVVTNEYLRLVDRVLYGILTVHDLVESRCLLERCGLALLRLYFRERESGVGVYDCYLD